MLFVCYSGDEPTEYNDCQARCSCVISDNRLQNETIYSHPFATELWQSK